jgi:hypothetical protein
VNTKLDLLKGAEDEKVSCRRSNYCELRTQISAKNPSGNVSPVSLGGCVASA